MKITFEVPNYTKYAYIVCCGNNGESCNLAVEIPQQKATMNASLAIPKKELDEILSSQRNEALDGLRRFKYFPERETWWQGVYDAVTTIITAIDLKYGNAEGSRNA